MVIKIKFFTLPARLTPSGSHGRFVKDCCLKYLDMLFNGITFHHCLPDTTEREDGEARTACTCHIASDLQNTCK